MEPVPRDEGAIAANLTGDRGDVDIPRPASRSLLTVDLVVLIELVRDSGGIATGGKRSYSPVRNRHDHHATGITAGKADGSHEQAAKFFPVARGVPPPVLIVHSDQKRHQLIPAFGLSRVDGG